ncbi:purine-cytosine permease family protein [Thiomonas bhubaneswarensis]|uniref:Purine-cytosine permease or related protein n=1 Tax=Thiomonas bhubaneswarensis TaxID=339866 RepID=A0A0K6I3Q1_9BURK|nr:cytosine permease [Thiomonas bhubaneswarensis]CUA97765.1 Purine-cytosine permease or related protein [Thiomonas bhubaneswarensis]
MAASTHSADAAHASQASVPAHERAFGFGDSLALWFSLGVGLLVMQVGAYLRPGLSLPQAAGAIALGSVLGAGLLAWVAGIGSRHGLSSSALIGHTLGQRFAMLPVALNVVQLLGWTAFELVVMRDGTRTIVDHVFGVRGAWVPVVATLAWGALLLVLASGRMIGLVRRFVSRAAMPLIVASLMWLTYQFGLKAWHLGFDALWARPGDGSMSLLAAVDLVVAMPVSWLPLVADYARYGRHAGATARGTWIGYAAANIWCYALGVLVISVSPGDTDMLSTLLLAQGGLIALGFILVDEVDNAFGDVHSGAVSTNFLRANWTIRRTGMTLVVLATVAALALPMHALEPFLLTLSSVFVPLFGVVIAQLAPGLPPKGNWRWGPMAVWLLGIGVFQLGTVWWPSWGSALPSLAFTLFAAGLLRWREARVPQSR